MGSMTRKLKDNAYYRRRYWHFRQEAMKKYGWECARCGFSDVRALQFNHLNGDGAKARTNKEWRRRFGGRATHDPREWLRALCEQPIRKDIELVCANCNWIYEYERGFRKGPPPNLDSHAFRIYKKREESKPPIRT